MNDCSAKSDALFNSVNVDNPKCNQCCNRDNFFDNLIRNEQTATSNVKTESKARECFQFFDEDRDGILNVHEFHKLCCQLISHSEQEWTQQDTEKIMGLLIKETERLDDTKFEICWKNWINPILAPKCALMVIDVQNDFISGSMALQNGEEVVPVINSLLKTAKFDEVIYSQDWHPSNHISFYDNRHMRKIHSTSPITCDVARPFDTVIFDCSKPIEQRLWCVHCLQNSTGAKLHKDLTIVSNHVLALKGTNPEQDNYSVLYPDPEPNNDTSGQALASRLRRSGITDLFLCGLAFDVCVGKTALDSRSLGFRTVVIEDACRGLAEESINKMITSVNNAGCTLVKAKEVAGMVSGHLRHPKLAHFAALDISAKGE